MTIDQLWDEIEAWYAQHVPDSEELNPGASEDQIASVEAELSVELPDEVKQSLRRHNGSQPSAWATCTLLECAEIVAESKIWRELTARDGGGDFPNEDAEVKPGWWTDSRVMLDKDADGSGYALDLDPSEHGNVGQVIRHESDGGPALAFGSYLEYLEYCLSELQEGEWRDGLFVPGDLLDY